MHTVSGRSRQKTMVQMGDLGSRIRYPPSTPAMAPLAPIKGAVRLEAAST